MHTVQLPVVLALRVALQGGPLRQVERVWVPWDAVPGHLQVPSDLSCHLPALPDSIHSRNQAHTRPGQVLPQSPLLPAIHPLVLPLPGVGSQCRISQLLLQALLLCVYLLSLSTAGISARSGPRYPQYGGASSASDTLLIISPAQDCIQSLSMLYQMKFTSPNK